MDNQQLSKESFTSLDHLVCARRPEALAMVRKMLSASRQDPFARAAVVSHLGGIEGEASERLLISLLAKDQSDVVRAKACSALFQVGSERSLDTLATMASKGAESIRAIAGFAHAVISHRLHRPSQFLHHPNRRELAIPTGVATSFQSRALADDRRREVLADLDASRLKLNDYAPSPIEISCAKVSWVITMHAPVAAEGFSAILHRAPAVLGVVARRSEEHQRWSVARLILGGPLKGDEFYVSIHRRDGVLDLAGTGSLSERTVDLATAHRPGGVPISARIYWNGAALVIAGISAQQRLPAKSPEPRRTEEPHAGETARGVTQGTGTRRSRSKGVNH